MKFKVGDIVSSNTSLEGLKEGKELFVFGIIEETNCVQINLGAGLGWMPEEYYTLIKRFNRKVPKILLNEKSRLKSIGD